MSAATSIPSSSAETLVRPERGSGVVRALTFLAGCYGVGLAVYLVLRLTLGDAFWWLSLLNTFTVYYFVPLLIGIPLLVLIGARRMAVRLLPLLLIGALLYGPLWLPRSVAAAGEGQPLKVVTFNIMVLTNQFDRMADWLATTGADLILLQEVGGLDPESVIDQMQPEYPYAVNLVGTTVMALSHYPVSNAALVDLGGWYIDRFELDVDGAALAVYNVHMDWPILHEPRFPLVVPNAMLQLALQYDETHRNVLIHTLLTVLDQETLPYVVAGDFNTSDQALIYGDLAAVMGDSFRETSTGLGTTWPAGPGDDGIPTRIPPLLRLDYIWHSPQLRALSTAIGPDLGSDHLPVMAVLALPT